MRFGIKQAIKWAFAVASVTSALQVAAAEKPWPMARGKALTQAFSNQDFGDGVHFAYQFLDGGELRGMNMASPPQAVGELRAANCAGAGRNPPGRKNAIRYASEVRLSACISKARKCCPAT